MTWWTLALSNEPYHRRSPGGGGIHTRTVPDSFFTRSVMAIGTPTSFLAWGRASHTRRVIG